MILFQVYAFRMRRYHWIECESWDMLFHICAERFGFDDHEPMWSIHRYIVNQKNVLVDDLTQMEAQ